MNPVNRFCFLCIFSFFLIFISTASASESRIYTVSLHELGYEKNIKYFGTEARAKFDFDLPANQRVETLTFHLKYQVSSSLLEKISHIKVILNGEVVEVLATSPQDVVGEKELKIQLPIHLLKENNALIIQLIGHYTLTCEDPSHPSLWIEINKESDLVFEGEPVVFGNDLALLPQPFFDKADPKPLHLPVVLYDTSSSYLEAAAIMTSWFGGKADFRTAIFPVHLGKIPSQGHAIVIMNNDQAMTELGVQQSKRANIKIIPNPSDSFGKLLLISGDNPQQIKEAATALATGSSSLEGSSASIDYVNVIPRQPYDAPNWLNTRRLIKLSELAPNNIFTVKGLAPQEVKVNFQLPPDLFSWQNKTALLDLKYFYSLQSNPDPSKLHVVLNDKERLGSVELLNRKSPSVNWFNNTQVSGQALFSLPIKEIGSNASLQFLFIYQPSAVRTCQLEMPDTFESAIDPNSTLDLTKLKHFISMPNLAAFINAGFPYSKMADLSETVVVLANHASAEEYTTFLNLMGNIGRATGYPTIKITVQTNVETKTLENKDVLLFSLGDTHPLAQQWSKFITQPETGQKINLKTNQIKMTGFESPISKNRSVITITGSKPQQVLDVINKILADSEMKAKIQGASVEMSDLDIKTLTAPNSHTYHIGDLGTWLRILWFFEQNPIYLILLFIVGAVPVSLVAYWALRAQANQRLHTVSNKTNLL